MCIYIYMYIHIPPFCLPQGGVLYSAVEAHLQHSLLPALAAEGMRAQYHAAKDHNGHYGAFLVRRLGRW